MPIPAKIDGHNVVIGAPENWDESQHGHCGALFVRFERVDGLDFMRSAWEIPLTEAHMLLCGSKLVLGVSAPIHPVLHMMVDRLPPDFQPCYLVRPFTNTTGKSMVRVEALFAGGDRLRRIFCEQHIDEGGLSIATGRGIEAVEELARQNGWIA